MKNTIVGALLVAGLAGQSALAEIRSFDFSASVSSLASAGNPFATSLPGIASGSTVALGDVINGRLSFDDQDIDWAATTFTGFQDTLSFEYTFAGGNTRVSASNALWSFTPNMIGTTDIFSVSGANAGKTVAANLLLATDGNAWTLGNGNRGALAVSWQGGSLNAELGSLVEVSPVPEPSTYAMLLLGAAVVGGAARRRSAGRAA